MKIIADESILLIDHYFQDQAECVRLPQHALCSPNIDDADVLICRSNIRINETLLANTQIKVVATPTSGFDHFDTHYLNNNQIQWLYAPGSNAESVADYVTACIAVLQKQQLLTNTAIKAAVIGVGHIGSIVAERLTHLGFEVLLNDPPRADSEPDFNHCELNELSEIDVICLHTPLTKSGNYPTYHLFDENLLSQLKSGCVIINASRGAILSTEAIKQFKDKLIFCLDVYEQEPSIDPEIIELATIATPHIAGHSIEAKWRSTDMIYQGLKEIFDLEQRTLPKQYQKDHLITVEQPQHWYDVVLANYDPRIDMQRLAVGLELHTLLSQHFKFLRLNYPPRHEFSSVRIHGELDANTTAIIKNLGFIL